METLHLSAEKQGDIEKAAQILRQGGLVGIPTETVYGLAADALNGPAVAGIFAAKNRPMDNPLIVHISDLSQWEDLVDGVPENARYPRKYCPFMTMPDLTAFRIIFRIM